MPVRAGMWVCNASNLNWFASVAVQSGSEHSLHRKVCREQLEHDSSSGLINDKVLLTTARWRVAVKLGCGKEVCHTFCGPLKYPGSGARAEAEKTTRTSKAL